MAKRLINTVVCLFNGTVESSVSALLMKRKGFQVIGVVINNRYQDAYVTEKHQQHALDSCKILDMPLNEITLSDKQWTAFNRAVLAEYRCGQNPDVDVLFTKHVIGDSLFSYCRSQSCADALALPFYSRTDVGVHIDRFTDMKGVKLVKAVDQLHDESVILSQIPQITLQRCILPIGELSQPAVIMIANSTELNQLNSHVTPKMVDMKILSSTLDSEFVGISGKLLDIVTGKSLGHHKGLHNYYPGQQVELQDQLYYVAEKNNMTGDIHLVSKADHPCFLTDTLFASLVYWIHRTPGNFYHEKQILDCEYKLCSAPFSSKCSLTIGALNEYCSNDHIVLSSMTAMRAVIPGHYCAFYQGEECIGSAKILKTGPSHHAMNYKKYTSSRSKSKSKWF